MGLFAVAPAALAFNGLLATKGTHLRTTNAVRMAAPSEALATLEGYSVETGMKVWDPLGIAPDDPHVLHMANSILLLYRQLLCSDTLPKHCLPMGDSLRSSTSAWSSQKRTHRTLLVVARV